VLKEKKEGSSGFWGGKKEGAASRGGKKRPHLKEGGKHIEEAERKKNGRVFGHFFCGEGV